MADDSSPSRDPLRLPFTERFMAALRVAETSGRWIYTSAPSQFGKTTAIRLLYLLADPFKRSDGVTRTPVAVAIAGGTSQRQHLLTSLAFSLAGDWAARQAKLLGKVAGWMAEFETRLVIVSDAHNLSWPEWRTIVTLHETLKSQFGLEVPFAFSGITPNIGILDGDDIDPVASQIRERLSAGYRAVRGHAGAEVKTALRLIARRDAPQLLEAGLLAHSALVERYLSAHEFAPARQGVAARHLIEVVHYVHALGAERPRDRMEKLIERAVELLRRKRAGNRQPPVRLD